MCNRSSSDAIITALRCLISEGVSGPEGGGDLDALVLGLVWRIDATLSAQVAEVLHDPKFQRLESTWRGLHYLVMESESSEVLKIRVLNVRRVELLHDFERAVDFDRTWLFKRVHDDVFGAHDGEPFGLLVGADEFGRQREDLVVLKGMSDVAAAAHAPFIAAAAPGLFGLERFADFDRVRDIGRIFASVEYAHWEAFRKSDNARFVGLTVPHVLLRLPYGRETVPIEEFAFEEGVEAGSVDRLLWGSAAWMLAVRIADSYARWGWPAEIRGTEGGGRVDGLPTFACGTDTYDEAARCPTDATISDRREYELSQLGFIPLVHFRHTGQAAFLSIPSCHRPRHYDTPEATAQAAVAAQLPVVLAAARFIHYIRLMTRDKVASFVYRDEIERFVNTWIQDYVWADDAAPHEGRDIIHQIKRCRRPLREARIEVGHDPARPGKFRGVAYLRFHSPNVALALPVRFDFPIG